MATTQDAILTTPPASTLPWQGPDATPQTFHIGTRRSILARAQAKEVEDALKRVWPHHRFEIHAMSTTGDLNQKTALHKFNDKALWTQELEVLLQDGELDLIVHSLKDMPTQLPVDLVLGGVTAREDARDALVVKASLESQYRTLQSLPEGSVVGTSSLRRIAQLKRNHPHLRFEDVRGNIGTRLAKLDDPDSSYSAIVIAVAGLRRLGMTRRIAQHLSADDGGMLHAVGQGALGIETRQGDERVAELLAHIGCERSTRATLAERSLMRTLEGGCSVPIGVETRWMSKTASLAAGGAGVGIKPADEYDAVSGEAKAVDAPTLTNGQHADDRDDDDGLTDELVMRAIVVSLDGSEAAEVESKRLITSREAADEFGWDVAKLLVARGADKILEKIVLNRRIVEKQGDA